MRKEEAWKWGERGGVPGKKEEVRKKERGWRKKRGQVWGTRRASGLLLEDPADRNPLGLG